MKRTTKINSSYKPVTITMDTLCIERAALLAGRMSTSVSGLLRQLVHEKFEKQAKKEELTV